jgi:hypothetical protein
LIVDYGRWKAGSCLISWPRGDTAPLDRRRDVDHGRLSPPLDLKAPEQADKGWLSAALTLREGERQAAIFVRLQRGELPLR